MINRTEESAFAGVVATARELAPLHSLLAQLSDGGVYQRPRVLTLKSIPTHLPGRQSQMTVRRDALDR